MTDIYRKAYHDPFLKMPDDYIKCRICGVYRQMDADFIVTPCTNCGDGEYQMSTQQMTMFQIEDLPLFSGTAPKGSISTFEIKEQSRQEPLPTNCHICTGTGRIDLYKFCWCEAGQRARRK